MSAHVEKGNVALNMPATGLSLTLAEVLSLFVLFNLATVTVMGVDLAQYAFWVAAGSLLLGYASSLGGKSLSEMYDVELLVVGGGGLVLVVKEFFPGYIDPYLSMYEPWTALAFVGLVVVAFLIVSFDVVRR